VRKGYVLRDVEIEGTLSIPVDQVQSSEIGKRVLLFCLKLLWCPFEVRCAERPSRDNYSERSQKCSD
jgi:hypothetical protein